MPVEEPFTIDDLPHINDLIDMTRKGIVATKRAISADIDTGDLMPQFEQDLRRLLALKQQYFPGEI